MSISAEQIRFKEFTVRLKGYDQDEVRQFLEHVAAAYRAAWSENGGSAETEGDVAGILAAAHEAAAKAVADAEREAQSIRAKAEFIRQQANDDAEKAKQILARSQERAATINLDCRRAQQLLVEAESKRADLLSRSEVTAAKIVETRIEEAVKAKYAEIAEYEFEQRKHASEDRHAARELLERTERKAATLLTEAEERAASISRMAEREARARVSQIQDEAADIIATAEEKARERVRQILAEGQQQLDKLAADERQLQERVTAAQSQFQAIVKQLVGDATIDLTTSDPVVAFEGSYDEAPADDADGELAALVSAAVGHAVEAGQE